jgi:hypothetical protein
MGACCTGNQTKSNSRDDELYTKGTKNGMLNSLKSQMLPQIEYEIDNSPLSQNLSTFLKTNPLALSMNIAKYSLEQLWNVCKRYLDDFTNSFYILYDLREPSKRQQNFLKKFKMLNYSHEELKMLSNSSKEKLSKYLKNKTLIVIINDENNMKPLEEILEILLSLDIKCKVRILTFDLNSKIMENTAKQNINLSILESKFLEQFPSILLPMKYFPHLNAPISIIFFDFLSSESESKNFYFQSIEGFSKNENFVKFLNENNLSNIMKISKSENKENINQIYLKSEFSSNRSLNIRVISFNHLESVSDLIHKNKMIMQYADVIKSDIKNGESLLIQMEKQCNPEVLCYFLCFLLWKFSEVQVCKFQNLLSEYSIYLGEEFQTFLDGNIEKIEDFLKLHFGYSQHENEIIADKIHLHNNIYQEISPQSKEDIKEKVYYYLFFLVRFVKNSKK